MLETLCILMLCAAIQGAMSAQLEYFMREGMIFQNWLPFIARNLVGWNKRAMLNYTDKELHGDRITPTPEEYMELAARFCFFYKPLGGCTVCMNTWLSFGTYWLVWLVLPELAVIPTILFFFSYTFLSGGFLKLFIND